MSSNLNKHRDVTEEISARLDLQTYLPVEQSKFSFNEKKKDDKMHMRLEDHERVPEPINPDLRFESNEGSLTYKDDMFLQEHHYASRNEVLSQYNS